MAGPCKENGIQPVMVVDELGNPCPCGGGGGGGDGRLLDEANVFFANVKPAGVAVVPAQGFVDVAGVDGGGLSRPIRTDTDGRIRPTQEPLTATASQDLSLAALSTTTAFARKFKTSFVALHLSAPLPGVVDQTLQVVFDSASGAAFDTVVKTQVVHPGDQDVFFCFEDVMAAGDEIRVTLTNTGAPAVTANVTVRGQET